MAKSGKESKQLSGNHEFRVWGRHAKARRRLERLADPVTVETYTDEYVLVDDPDWNVKLRAGDVKVKQRVDVTRGFDCWESSWLDGIHAAKGELRRQLRDDTTTVVVRKKRRRFEVGSARAEVTDVVVDGGPTARSIAIEGDDLDELVRLRKKLGLTGEANVPMHEMLDQLVRLAA